MALLKNKNSQSVKYSFDNIFATSKRKPVLTDTDDWNVFAIKFNDETLKKKSLEDIVIIHQNTQSLLKDSMKKIELPCKRLLSEQWDQLDEWNKFRGKKDYETFFQQHNTNPGIFKQEGAECLHKIVEQCRKMKQNKIYDN